MKKTYMTPELSVVKLVISNHLLQVSGTGISNKEATGDALGRENSFWDEEE